MTVLCSKESDLVDSKHDIIISEFRVPQIGIKDKSNTSKAPRISNERVHTIWLDEGIDQYKKLLPNVLADLQTNWANPISKVSFSTLLQCTNQSLISAASLSNKTVKSTKVTFPHKEAVP